MIDDQSESAYQFANSNATPTAVIALGRERSHSRISAIYANQSGNVDFYVLDRLPVNPRRQTSPRFGRSRMSRKAPIYPAP